MSEKPTAAKLIEFDKLKEAARESKEDACSKKEQIPISKPMEDAKKTVENAEESGWRTIILPKIFTSDESEKLEAKNIETFSKTLADISMSSDRTREVLKSHELTKFEESASSIKLKEPRYFEICPKSKIWSETSKFEFHRVPGVSQKLHPTTTSEMSTSAKFEAREIPDVAEMYQMSKVISETFTSNKSEDRQVPEICQMPRTMFEMFTSTKLEASAKFEAREIPNVAEMCQIPKTTFETSISKKTEDPEVSEIRRTYSMSKISDKTEEPEIPEVRRTHSTAAEISVPIKFDDVEDVEVDGTRATSKVSTSKSGDEKEKEEKFTEDIKDDDSKVSTKLEESFLNMKSTDDTGKTKMTPIIGKDQYETFTRRIWAPMSAPNFKEPHLVLATHHMVPSLPIALFEILAEMIEVVTKRPVVLLHECRESRRHIATEIADIVVLPPYEIWRDGVLLPASFVFEHHLNHDDSAFIYADVIVTNDRAPHIKDIMDLRGHRCAIPNERDEFSPAAMLFTHLYMKGENMLFFGTVLEAGTQPEVLKMVASKQAEVGIVESPVLRYHKNQPGMESIHVLTSIGPLPPYRIMIKNTLADKLAEKLTTYLLDVKKSSEWTQRLWPFGVLGFHENSMDYYKVVHKKRSININIPYY